MNEPTGYMLELRDAVTRLPADRLMPLRLAALEQFAASGLPTARQEDWKYTDLAPVVEVGFDTPPTNDFDVAIRSATGDIEADWLVIGNGEARLQKLRGAEVRLLSDSGTPLESDMVWTQLNTALLRDGLHIRVAARKVVKRPIGVLFIDSSAAGSGMSQGRVRIEMDEGSSANFIEMHMSLGDNRHHANSVIDLDLGAGALANYVRIQNRARHHSQTARLDVRQDRDSVFNHAAFDFGGALIRNDLAISIEAPGSLTTFDGLYLGGDGQHIDNHTRADHRVGPAVSRQEYRGILTGDARCVWNGKAIVHKGADGTDAAQANHNLLLSDKAEIDAKPELEIYADEVKCSHGTTVGQLDETALYYLRTRGLDKQLARQLLTHAFAHAIVGRAPVAAAQAALVALLERRLVEMLGESGP